MGGQSLGLQEELQNLAAGSPHLVAVLDELAEEESAPEDRVFSLFSRSRSRGEASQGEEATMEELVVEDSVQHEAENVAPNMEEELAPEASRTSVGASGGQTYEIPSADRMSDLFDELDQREGQSTESVAASANIDLEVAEWISKRLQKEICRNQRKLKTQVEALKEKKKKKKRKRLEEASQASSPADPELEALFDEGRESDKKDATVPSAQEPEAAKMNLDT